jgi:hypothetical protein
MSTRVKPGNKTMQQFMDYDYLDKLNPEEKEWFGKFNHEYYAHNFSEAPVHPNATKAKTEADERENKARADIWNNADAEYLDTVPDSLLGDTSQEPEEIDCFEIYQRYGFDKAIEKITDEILDDLTNTNIDEKDALSKYYAQRFLLEKAHKLTERRKRRLEQK